MKKTYYHATPKDRVFDILVEGISASWDGYVYLCDNENDALVFMKLHHPEGGLFAVIPIELDDSMVEESTDHNKETLKINAYVYKGDIPAELIPKNLDDIPLFELSCRLKN